MNRFKLICLVIILAVVAILWVQNSQELLALEFLCPGGANQSCLYLTPQLPLAAWMLIFAIAGIISSLLWQFLNQVGTPVKKNQSPSTPTRPLENRLNNNFRREDIRPQPIANSNKQPSSDWEEKNSEDWEAGEIPPVTREGVYAKKTVDSIPTKIQDTKPSDSLYSYNFREGQESKKSESSIPQDKTKTTNKIDDVYDATYRTVNNPKASESNTGEDDEQWI